MRIRHIKRRIWIILKGNKWECHSTLLLFLVLVSMISAVMFGLAAWVVG